MGFMMDPSQEVNSAMVMSSKVLLVAEEHTSSGSKGKHSALRAKLLPKISETALTIKL